MSRASVPPCTTNRRIKQIDFFTRKLAWSKTKDGRIKKCRNTRKPITKEEVIRLKKSLAFVSKYYETFFDKCATYKDGALKVTPGYFKEERYLAELGLRIRRLLSIPF